MNDDTTRTPITPPGELILRRTQRARATAPFNEALDTEREFQEITYGTAHDQANSFPDWFAALGKQMGDVADMTITLDHALGRGGEEPLNRAGIQTLLTAQRGNLIRLAAVARAEVEAIDAQRDLLAAAGYPKDIR